MHWSQRYIENRSSLGFQISLPELVFRSLDALGANACGPVWTSRFPNWRFANFHVFRTNVKHLSRHLLGTLAPAECLRGVELDMFNPGSGELQNLWGRNSNLWRHLDFKACFNRIGENPQKKITYFMILVGVFHSEKSKSKSFCRGRFEPRSIAEASEGGLSRCTRRLWEGTAWTAWRSDGHPTKFRVFPFPKNRCFFQLFQNKSKQISKKNTTPFVDLVDFSSREFTFSKKVKALEVTPPVSWQFRPVTLGKFSSRLSDSMLSCSHSMSLHVFWCVIAMFTAWCVLISSWWELVEPEGRTVRVDACPGLATLVENLKTSTKQRNWKKSLNKKSSFEDKWMARGAVDKARNVGRFFLIVMQSVRTTQRRSKGTCDTGTSSCRCRKPINSQLS